MKRLQFLVRGRVQGVGFRWFAQRAAAAAGVSGYAENLADGSVRCEAEGSEAALQQFAAALRQGPRSGRVDDLQQQELPPQGGSGFTIR